MRKRRRADESGVTLRVRIVYLRGRGKRKLAIITSRASLTITPRSRETAELSFAELKANAFLPVWCKIQAL